MLLAFDLVAKGALVLLAAATAAWLLRRGPAATRYLVWSIALVALLALPVVQSAVPAWSSPWMLEVPASWVSLAGTGPFEAAVSTNQAASTSELQNDIAVLPRPTPRAPAVVAPEPSPPAAKGPSASARDFPASGAETQASPSLQRATLPANAVPTWPALLAGIYLCGVAAILLHLTVGAIGVVRVVRGARPVTDGPLRREFERAVGALGIERDVRLLESDATSVPVAWELRRPAVLMPRSARRWPLGRYRAAVLHELAHVRRRDCQMQLVGQVALALHWPNPLAWRAARRLRIEREHACDDAVLSLGIRASEYADHLLQIARELVPRREPAWASVAMARSAQLESRVEAILDPDNPRRLPGRRTTMTALITAMALLLPLAALQPGVAAPQAPSASPHPPTSSAYEPAPLATPLTPAAAAGAQQPEPTIDDLVKMRIHGVTTEFIEQLRAAFDRPVTVNELVQMRIHGTTPEFVRDVQDLFSTDVTIRDLTTLRIHGTTADYVREMRDALGDDLTVRDVTNLRIHGATPEFVNAVREVLGEDLSARDVTSMRIHGADADYVRDMRDLLADEELSARDVTSMRIHGADADYVRDMRDLLADEELSVRDITSMRIHGVTVELVRELQDDGFENLTADDLVKMKIHGFDRWLQRRRGGR